MTAHVRVQEWEKVLSAAVANAAERRAKNDAFVAMSRELPDPAEYARYLSLPLAQGLRNARSTPDGYRAGFGYLVELRRNGLADARTRYLTAFGIAVRRELMADDE